ncbi:unnamed protein product [Orchesella dallaii]|uniref:Ion transport domain-containing protein n=1 Tax=Orchesella dallaii TaxID=48710 RepID=A0ABP1QB32_9HEXA
MGTDSSNSHIPVCWDRMSTNCLVLKITSKAIDFTNHILSPSKSTSDRNWFANESTRDLAESSVRMWYNRCDLMHCQCKQRNTSGWHPIHLASLIGNQNLILEILNKERDVVNAEYNFKMEVITPLMCGAASSSIGVMRLLAGQGANFSSNPIKDLEWAIKGKSPECLIFVAEKATISPKEGTIINMLELFTTGILKDDAAGILEVILEFPRASVKRLTLSTIRRSVLAHKIQVECRALFFIALEKGFKDVVKLLIKKAKVNLNHVVFNGTPAMHYTIQNNTKDDLAAEILDILLNNGTMVNGRDGKGRTALNIAASAGYVKCAFVLIQREAEICVSDLKNLNERVPQFLETYFDSLISSRGLTSSPSGELVSIDIRFMGVKRNGKKKEEIKIQDDCKELLFLKFVIDDGQKELLMHPVIQTYLYTKWLICRKYFYCSVLLHICQLLCFTILTTEKYCVEDYCHTSIGNESGAQPLHNGSSYSSDNRPLIWFAVLGTSTFIIRIIMVLLNAFLFGTVKTNAMKHKFECVLLVSILVTIIPFPNPQDCSSLNFQRGTASISILLAWCYSLFYLARHPHLGIYVEMLLKVFKNFATFFLTYTCVLIGYALAFSVVLPKNSDFKTFISRMRKILTWMVGDLEIEIPKKEADLQIVVNILYISFILTVTVALINLLIGLAVHDIQGLLIKSKLNESIRQVHYLHMIQSMIYSKPMTNLAPLGIRKFFRRSIKLPLNVHIITVFPNKSDDKRLPQYLKQDALAVAKRNIVGIKN